jgi:hypothetical protein
MVVYLVLCSLLFVWKLRAGRTFWLGVGTTSFFYTHILDDFNIPWGVEDHETATALLVFPVVFRVLLVIGRILAVGREYQYQTVVLPYLKPEPKRPFLEQFRQRWG